MKTLWLIDGNSLAYRGFFAFIKKPLRNSQGQNTSAAFGFVNSLFKLLNEKQPKYLLITFDTGAPTFRHKQFDKYKATRPPIPTELLPQLPIIKKIVHSLGIKTLEIEGIEADDAIGTVARMATQQGWEVIIFSEDKDFLQLEGPKLKIFNPRTFEFIYAKDKLGIQSERVSDLLALTGDTIDNIPGVPGIGPKTATDLILAFGSVEEIIANANKIEKEKLREAIKDYKDQIILSKALATIETNCDIKIKLEELGKKQPDESTLFSIFRELGFLSIMKKLKPTSPKEYTIGNLDELLNSITSEVSLFFFDSYFSLTNRDGEAFVFRDAQNKLNKIMQNPKIKKITPNSKLLFAKFDVHGEVFDLSLASYLLKPDLKEHSIDNLAIEWLGKPLSDLKSDMINSLGERAEVSYTLSKVLEEELKTKDLYTLFNELEVPLARVLADMEKTGVLIDRDYFHQESMALEIQINEIEYQIYSNVGIKFNLRSPAQLSEVLFERLKFPKPRRTSGKTHYSTDQSVLTELAKNYDLPKKILLYRELFKLKSTYIDAIPALADDNNRVHTTWQQTVTATGRLSSTNPNLQNIPKQETRKGFIAPDGWVILSADYSQIELRILASVSGDPTLIEAFTQGKDIHTETAALIFNLSKSQVTKAERERAKAVNFGIVYGMGPYGLSQRLGIGVEEAATFIASYFTTYPKVKEWIDNTLNFVRQTKYVTTLMGRKRWLSGINSDNIRVREAEERAAINAPIQGSAADMIKIAMIRIHEKLKNINSHLIMQVHDELVLEVPKSEIEVAKEIVTNEMETALPLNVPVVVEIGIGKNWYEAH